MSVIIIERTTIPIIIMPRDVGYGVPNRTAKKKKKKFVKKKKKDKKKTYVRKKRFFG